MIENLETLSVEDVEQKETWSVIIKTKEDIDKLKISLCGELYERTSYLINGDLTYYSDKLSENLPLLAVVFLEVSFNNTKTGIVSCHTKDVFDNL